MPHQTILGYCLDYKDSIQQLKENGLRFNKNEHQAMFKNLNFMRDVEKNCIYIAFWEDYTEKRYESYPIDFTDLLKFKETVEKLIQECVIPGSPLFGVHTYF